MEEESFWRNLRKIRHAREQKEREIANAVAASKMEPLEKEKLAVSPSPNPTPDVTLETVERRFQRTTIDEKEGEAVVFKMNNVVENEKLCKKLKFVPFVVEKTTNPERYPYF